MRGQRRNSPGRQVSRSGAQAEARAILQEISRVLDPAQETPNWLPQVRCEDCEALLDAEPGYFSGTLPRVCRPCQNKRYEAKIAGTPQGERRKRRKALLAKKRRLESRIERDQAELAGVLLELGAAAARGAQP